MLGCAHDSRVMSLPARLLRRTMATHIKQVPIPHRGVDYRGKVVLAPMVRSGELPSRLTALHYGADLVWGPETVDKAIIGTTRRDHAPTKTVMWTKPPTSGTKPADVKDNLIFQTHPGREGKKLIFQLGTANPELAVEAAKMVAGDVAGIDVNSGCPKPFSIHCGMGAALLRTPDLLVSILEALVKNITPEYGIGISVKIRILETAEQTEVLVRRLVATGITGLTVHCRTTPMRPRERAIRGQLRMITDICREAGVACLVNGDVENREHALQLMEEFGVDGAMIATCAEKNSSCFRTKEDGGLAPWEEVSEEYLKYAMEVENKYGNTKYLLNQIVPGKASAHKNMMAAKCYTVLCEEALNHPHLVGRAREVDEALGIDSKGAKKAKANVPNNKLPKSESAKDTKKRKYSSTFAQSEKSADFRSTMKKSLSEHVVTAQHDTPVPEGIAVPV